MNFRVKYMMSDGSIITDASYNEPLVYAERDAMRKEAKEIEKRVKRKVQLTPEELENDEDVKRYRELMRKIWSFAQKAEVIKRIVACNCCDTVDNLVLVMDVQRFYTKLTPTKVVWKKVVLENILCRKCAGDMVGQSYESNFIIRSLKETKIANSLLDSGYTVI